MISIFPCFIYVDDRNVNLVKLIFRFTFQKSLSKWNIVKSKY